jgi:membrane-associated phospholipid phosphatase
MKETGEVEKNQSFAASSRSMVAVTALSLLSLVLIPFDEVLLRTTNDALRPVLAHPLPHFLVHESRHLGTVIGFAVVTALVAALDRRRSAALLVAVVWLSTALSLQVVKEVAGRVRPVYALELPKEWRLGFDAPPDMGIEPGHDIWLPLWHERHFFMNTIQRSFPSGHAANAAALATVLFALYGRKLGILLVIIAVFNVLDRLFRFQHYWSDVLLAAGWGWATAQLWLGSRLAARIPPCSARDGDD